MSNIQIRNSRHSTRIAGFALSLMAAAALSACGGDDNGGGNGGGGGGGGSVGTADLTVAGTKAQVGTFGTLIQALNTLDGLASSTGATVASAPRPMAKAGSVRAKALNDCDDGGSIEDTGPTSKNVNSPFTSEALSVSGTLASDCKYVESSSQGGNNIDISITLNGSTEGGSLEGGDSNVEYFRIGDDSAPYSLDYDIKTSGSAQGTSFSSEIALGMGIRYRDDYMENSSGSEDRFVMAFDGDYDASANSGGQGGSTSGSFTYYIGKDGAPFIATEDNTGTSISGEYGFKLSGDQGAACPSGGVTISTLDPLTDSESSASPFASGRLKFSSGDKSSEVMFNNDGTVTVTGSDGQMDTFDYAQAVAAAAPCAGYGLAGLYLAAGLGTR